MNESTLIPAPRPSGVEVSAAASAALAKATIEAKFVIALQRPRSLMNARASILEACKRPAFALGAWYRKPVGKGVEGFSIRFAEAALNAWRNVDVAAVTAWEDDDKRLVRITVTDLESNLSYSDEVLLNKTVERSTQKEGQDVIGERLNSQGRKVFILRATEDDLLNKINAAKSKSIRNSGLRLIPQDILEEAREALLDTRRKGGGEDPRAGIKKLADAFSAIGVQPTDLEAYLGHTLTAVQPRELDDLRGIYTAIREGEASWSDYAKPATAETQSDAPDEIPGTETPARTAPVPPSAKPAAPRASFTSAQDELADLVTTAGFTFDDFRQWGEQSGNVPKAGDLTCFTDLDRPTAQRLLRSKAALLAQLKALKEGGAA